MTELKETPFASTPLKITHCDTCRAPLPDRFRCLTLVIDAADSRSDEPCRVENEYQLVVCTSCHEKLATWLTGGDMRSIAAERLERSLSVHGLSPKTDG